MTKQAAAEIGSRRYALFAKVVRQGQIEQDVVIIAGVECNAVKRAGGADAAQHVERPVAIERRDLNGDDIVDRGKASPEISAENDAADRGLQIEADQRNHACDRLTMRDDIVLGGRFHRGQAEQTRVIADAECGLRLRDRLLCWAGEACDHG